jgi:hypothetical protein
MYATAILVAACTPGARVPTGARGAPLETPAGPRRALGPAVARQVIITMSPATVDALFDSGYFLYGFKAVGAWDKAGVPLVWLRTQGYSLSTVVAWQERYEAYTSPSTPVQAIASYPIALDQTLCVEHPSGTGTVIQGGAPGAISIENRTATPFACGISQPVNGGFAPLCQLPLYGRDRRTFTPLARVLLLFSAQPRPPGTIARTADGPGVLIDFGDVSTREVTFDVNTGWRWGGGVWAHEVGVGADIVPLLVVPPPGP